MPFRLEAGILRTEGNLLNLRLLVASFAKNQGRSQAGEANFKQVKRPISVLVVHHRILGVSDSTFHPLCVNSDKRTFVTFELHNGIRGVRFPTDYAMTNGQAPGVDLESAGQPEISGSSF